MSKMRTLPMLAAGCILQGGMLFGQTASEVVPGGTANANSGGTDSSAGRIDPALQTFQQEQQALAQSFHALMAQGATSDQIKAWQIQNADALAAQRQRAITMGAAASSRPLAPAPPAKIPADATPEMTEFLNARVDLYNKYAALHNQQMASGNAKGSAEQAFQQQNADELQAQGQRAKVIAAQSASRPLPVPAPLSIPPGVSPQMKDFLTLRDQIMRTQIALWNQDVAATAEQRSADLRQWEQQNAGALQQLRQLSGNLSQTQTTQAGPN